SRGQRFGTGLLLRFRSLSGCGHDCLPQWDWGGGNSKLVLLTRPATPPTYGTVTYGSVGFSRPNQHPSGGQKLGQTRPNLPKDDIDSPIRAITGVGRRALPCGAVPCWPHGNPGHRKPGRNHATAACHDVAWAARPAIPGPVSSGTGSDAPAPGFPLPDPPWCKGSTSDFGSDGPGSNPGGGASVLPGPAAVSTNQPGAMVGTGGVHRCATSRLPGAEKRPH